MYSAKTQIRVKSIKTTCDDHAVIICPVIRDRTCRLSRSNVRFFYFFYIYSTSCRDFLLSRFGFVSRPAHSSVSVRPRTGGASTRNGITVRRHLYSDCVILLYTTNDFRMKNPFRESEIVATTVQLDVYLHLRV